MSGAAWFAALIRPPLVSPDPSLTPAVACAYAMLGVAGWLVWWRCGPGRLLRLWGWQLLFNALWAPCLFGLHSPMSGLLLAAPGLLITLVTLPRFARVNRWAACMTVPSAVWIGYATYLAAGTWWLNHG